MTLVQKRAFKTNLRKDDITWTQQIEIKTEDSVLMRTRKTIFSVLTEPTCSKTAKVISIIMSFIIFGSVLELVLSTVYDLNNTEDQIATFDGFELFFNIIFSIDYFSKVLFCPNYYKLPKFMVSFAWIVDLLSILPFYIELCLQGQSSDASVLRIIRIVRIFRILRILKASKNLKQVHMMFEAFKKSIDGVIMLLIMLLNCLIFFGAFVYFSELGIEDYQGSLLVYNDGPLAGATSGFQSIPHAMWWAIVTMTTVGYGDM
eukprot:NODE_85_length_22232_cov_1.318619.p10 type:complete len:260 gc:universal NODE_85_length_22232_cov_1.318619:21462-20683(-)